MKNLTVGDLRLAIEDILDTTRPRLAVLAATLTGALYIPILKKRLAALLALPEVRDPKRALAEELALTDVDHDGYGGAFWDMTGAYLRAPDTPEALKKSLVELREVFLKGGLAELKGSYAEEAFHAKERLGKLDQHKELLNSLPLASGKTLYAWVQSFLESGLKLDTLTSSRTYKEASESDGSRAAIGPLRGEILGTLSTLRAALEDERKDNSSLPENLEALVFGYLDELQAKRYSPTATPTTPSPTTPASSKDDPGV
jgi:hypothetical protein